MTISRALLLFARADVGAIEGWFRVSEGRVVARDVALERLPIADDGERVVLILQGDEVAIRWLELPALTEAQAAAAARLALAEHSLAPIDSLHVAIGEIHGGRRMVAAIDADLLGRWIAWAHAIGIDLDHIVPLPLLLAYGEGPTRLWARPGLSVVRGHDRSFAAEPDLALAILGDETTDSIDDAGFEAELPAALAMLPLDLRQGRFARRRIWRIDDSWKRRMKRLAIAAAILLVAIPVARLGRIAFDSWRIEREAGRVARLALGRESLPEGPHAAMTMKAEGLRGPGMGFPAGSAILFDAVRQTPNVSLIDLDFSTDGVLTASVSGTSPADVSALVARLSQSGLAIEATPGGDASRSVLRISRA
jgi:general secretion pathway protein L